MKYTIVALAAVAAVANAQVVFNSTTNTFQCLGNAAGKNFCAGDSLQTNIIIRCSGTVGQPGNCNDNLAGVPPVGVKTFAPCYQSSNTSGDAACSYNGIAYPDSGASFPIPGASSSSVSTAAPETTSKATVTSGYLTLSATTTECTTCKTFSTPLCPGTNITRVCGPCGATIGSVVPCPIETFPPTSAHTTSAPITTSMSSASGGASYSVGNTTTYTTGYPTITAVNGASNVAIQGGLIAGLIGFVAALL